MVNKLYDVDCQSPPESPRVPRFQYLPDSEAPHKRAPVCEGGVPYRPEVSRPWRGLRWFLLFAALLLVLGLVVYYLLIDVRVRAKLTTTTEDSRIEDERFSSTSRKPVTLFFDPEGSSEVIEIVEAPDLSTEPSPADEDEEIMMTSDRDSRLPVHPTLPSSRTEVVSAPGNETDTACFSPRLEMCKGVLPYDLTTVPLMPGIDLDAALPYLEMIVQSKCSLRARQLICSLLEPACQPMGDSILPPCRKACKAVAEECSDFMLLTLDLSKVFHCDDYPDTDDPEQCANFAKGDVCLAGEFRCPEGGMCIPSRWRCDTVDDCPLAADEVNCTICSSQEIKCEPDNRCIPLKWRCDGNNDCPDGSDELHCAVEGRGQPHASPCPVGELRCLDGRCITMQQLCDGLYDCSDGADEANCGPK